MAESNNSIYEAAINSKYSTVGNVLSVEDLACTWDNASHFIEKNLNQQKGVNIPNLGVFTLVQRRVDIGHGKFYLVQRPVFQISQMFVQQHKLTCTKHYVSGKIPVLPLNFSILSYESPFTRDIIESAIKEVIQFISKTISDSRTLIFVFNGIGRLIIKDLKVKMQFYREFVISVDGSGNVVDSMKNRAGTADSVISNRSISRLSVSNLSLPKIDDKDSAENKVDFHDKRRDEVLFEVEENDPISDEYEKKNDLEIHNLELDTVEKENKCEKENKDKFVRKSASGRLSVPIAQASGVVFFEPDTTDVPRFPSRNSHLSKSSPSLNLSRNSIKENYSQIERKPDYNLHSDKIAKISFANEIEEINNDSTCGHKNSGQELCYLCHQRRRKNVPVFLTEERKKQQVEQDKLFQQLHLMKDTEAILEEQERILKQKKESQMTSAFNLGVAEAIDMKNKSRNEEFEPSFIFHKLKCPTPPLKKNLENQRYIRSQITEKEKQENKLKLETFQQGVLEQKQIADDLNEQKESYYRDKKNYQDDYMDAFSTQLIYRSLPLPKFEPDSVEPIFGANDMSDARLVERKTKALSFMKEQMETAEQKKRAQIIKCLKDAADEDKVIKRAKNDLIQDRSHAFKRQFLNRKGLENDWFLSNDHKQKKMEEEKQAKMSTDGLVQEQLDCYDRCNQCKRNVNNYGQSNVWRESRYTSGARIIV